MARCGIGDSTNARIVKSLPSHQSKRQRNSVRARSNFRVGRRRVGEEISGQLGKNFVKLQLFREPKIELIGKEGFSRQELIVSFS
jgi:hypothetical protein